MSFDGRMGRRSTIAFFAPMKPPDHPTPSGDRRIARLLMAALELAGRTPVLASRLRTLDMAGDPAAQDGIARAADAEAARLIGALSRDRPDAWLTYHSYHKAPDLLGPAVSDALGIPYLVAEPSISPRRRGGPWARFAAASEAALARADRLLWTTARDRPALEAAGHSARMVHLPPFLETGPEVPARPAGHPLQLLTVAMMRPGDKLESYRRLAAALPHVDRPWRLTVIGDGPERGAVETLLRTAGKVSLAGAVDDPARLRAAYAEGDVMVWPGVGEGVGMVWLEAQEAGLPVVAEDGAAARALVHGGLLAPPDDPADLARTIAEAADRRAELSALATDAVRRHHSLSAAADTLDATLTAVGA